MGTCEALARFVRYTNENPRSGQFARIHAHWGGGSPSILREAESIALRAALEENFQIVDDAEVSVEVDPSDLENADISALVALGITRASIGVQDFDGLP